MRLRLTGAVVSFRWKIVEGLKPLITQASRRLQGQRHCSRMWLIACPLRLEPPRAPRARITPHKYHAQRHRPACTATMKASVPVQSPRLVSKLHAPSFDAFLAVHLRSTLGSATPALLRWSLQRLISSTSSSKEPTPPLPVVVWASSESTAGFMVIFPQHAPLLFCAAVCP